MFLFGEANPTQPVIFAVTGLHDGHFSYSFVSSADSVAQIGKSSYSLIYSSSAPSALEAI